MIGLTPATSGTATIYGRAYADLPNPGREVGQLLDASAQHAGRTGREVLTNPQRFMGLPYGRVEEMLDVVSLRPNQASRRVRDYSLGMRQRLGLATALLGEPELLILDEPANGLDPSGFSWMRGLLRDYANRGGTGLLSSHLLLEIEVVADDLVLIGNGRIVAQGTKRELLQSAGSLVRSSERELVAAALTASGVFRPTAPAWRRSFLSSPPRPSAKPPVTVNQWESSHDRPRDRRQDAPGQILSRFEDCPPRHPAASDRLTTELRKMFDTWARVLADRQHRHQRPTGYGWCCPSRQRHPNDRLQLCESDRVPDGGYPARRRHSLGDQRVEPTQRAHDFHARAAPSPGDRCDRSVLAPGSAHWRLALVTRSEVKQTMTVNADNVFLDREGLTDDEESEQVAVWISPIWSQERSTPTTPTRTCAS